MKKILSLLLISYSLCTKSQVFLGEKQVYYYKKGIRVRIKLNFERC